MCLVHRGDYSFTIFLPPNFTIRVWHTVVERGEGEEQQSLNYQKRAVCQYPRRCYTRVSLEMDRLMRVERQKFPFTIENILRKYPNSNEDIQSCGTSGVGLKDKAVSPAGGQTETVHHTCLCCCYCSHCGDIFQTDFMHEGKTKT